MKFFNFLTNKKEKEGKAINKRFFDEFCSGKNINEDYSVKLDEVAKVCNDYSFNDYNSNMCEIIRKFEILFDHYKLNFFNKDFFSTGLIVNASRKLDFFDKYVLKNYIKNCKDEFFIEIKNLDLKNKLLGSELNENRNRQVYVIRDKIFDLDLKDPVFDCLDAYKKQNSEENLSLARNNFCASVIVNEVYESQLLFDKLTNQQYEKNLKVNLKVNRNCCNDSYSNFEFLYSNGILQRVKFKGGINQINGDCVLNEININENELKDYCDKIDNFQSYIAISDEIAQQFLCDNYMESVGDFTELDRF